jgi:hypothetical protein
MLHLSTRMILFGASERLTETPLSAIKAGNISSFRCGITQEADMARKAISRKIRFEVFKRDGFKCQYCGASAPDVVLHVDHINPVSKGGDNELINLITSCQPCNSGKSDRELSDDSAIQKQRAMLDELNERREQLEMMLKWRDGMKDINEQKFQAVINEWESVTGGYYLNETGEKQLRTLLRKFPLNVVLEAVQIASEQYLSTDDDGEITLESVNLAWSKIGGISRNITLGDDEKQLYYIRGICRNRFTYCNVGMCIDLLKQAHRLGAEHDALTDIAKSSRNWSQWTSAMYQLMDSLQGRD